MKNTTGVQTWQCVQVPTSNTHRRAKKITSCTKPCNQIARSGVGVVFRSGIAVVAVRMVVVVGARRIPISYNIASRHSRCAAFTLSSMFDMSMART
jgi:hypothetical protein